MHIEDIKDNYAKMPTYKLVQLASEIQGLRPEVIPLLQAELFKRSETLEALKITEYLVSQKEQSNFSSYNDVYTYVNQRLQSGDSLENIKQDLSDKRINIFDVLNQEEQSEELVFDYITNLKEEGLSEEEINHNVNTSLGIDKKEVELLKAKLIRRGKQNVIVGYSFITMASICILLSIAVRGGLGIGGLILFGIGIWRVSEGNKQIKVNKLPSAKTLS